MSAPASSHLPPEKDAHTGTATTGHEWDGIKELNTPLPRWWLYTFYACIVWAFGYWLVYPAWPLIWGYTRVSPAGTRARRSSPKSPTCRRCARR